MWEKYHILLTLTRIVFEGKGFGEGKFKEENMDVLSLTSNAYMLTQYKKKSQDKMLELASVVHFVIVEIQLFYSSVEEN